MKTVKRDIVGGFIFSHDEKVLLGKNKKGGVYKDMWVVPGGGVEAGETTRQALRREMLEEVGIDVEEGTIRQLEGVPEGQSEKYMKELGEVALVVMRFIDYEIRLDQLSNDVVVSLDDDLELAQWFGPEQLQNMTISHPTRTRLVELGMIV